MTGRICIDLFTTLDGVAQAPGGPDEDTSGGFAFGGWQAPLPDEMVAREVQAGMEHMDALLLGRRTYDIFAAYWPHHVTGPEGGIGRLFNRLPKYVASRGNPGLGWEGSQLLGDDVAAAVAELRERHAEVHVVGSIDFVQTLMRKRLFDELTLWVYPVLLGQGKKVFPDGAAPSTLRLLAPAATGDGGAVMLRYAPGGDVTTGSMDAG